ncbi:MAG: sigma-54 dependent transcriptional regulator [Geobacteraceae bacterium]|nr:sigma-54 dependent transcriptional regulator [Geobacteraceae bacterium]
MKHRLLIVDDDPEILAILKRAFEGEGFEVFLESDSESALARIRADQPHVAILDINLPGKSGLEILRAAKRVDSRLSIIMTTGQRTTQNAIESMKHGAYDYLTKPFDLKKIRTAVKKALECNLLSKNVRYVARPDIDAAEHDEDLMIGSSPEMTEIWKTVGMIANSDTPVLIQGESGTGKELLARAIYNNSRRKDRPFLAINCAALQETLLESELFGHEKGAFTDAHIRRIGKFEQCDGGTIFLDEVGEMSPACQGKLLRVIESQAFERLGGNETIQVDVRIIAATNQSLLTAVREKRFRLDLFYRLRVVTFDLPPLRERPDDLSLLVDFFIGKFSRQYGKRINGLEPDALKMIASHPWEGNIRELKNAVNSAVLFCKGDMLTADDIRPLMRHQSGINEIKLEAALDDYSQVFRKMVEPIFDKLYSTHNPRSFGNVTMGLEKALIEMLLEKCDNSLALAAKALGISRNTLRDRIERYGINVDRGD